MIFAQFFLDGHGCHQSIFIVIHTPSCWKTEFHDP
jgi:hypothetical protein